MGRDLGLTQLWCNNYLPIIGFSYFCILCRRPLAEIWEQCCRYTYSVLYTVWIEIDREWDYFYASGKSPNELSETFLQIRLGMFKLLRYVQNLGVFGCSFNIDGL